MSDSLESVARSLTLPGDAARLSALAQMADAAAHEFNNLRSTIEGTLDLITTNPGATLTERRLARLRSASERAGALAAGLAALARLRRGAGAPFDVAAWLRTTQSGLAALTAERVTLALDLPDGPFFLAAHPDGLRVILRALIANAAAAGPRSGRVTIALANGARARFMLSVSDDGAGMAPPVAARAQEAFFTTHPPAAGLGLTLAELFAKEQGGELILASTPGAGTTVTLSLPNAR